MDVRQPSGRPPRDGGPRAARAPGPDPAVGAQRDHGARSYAAAAGEPRDRAVPAPRAGTCSGGRCTTISRGCAGRVGRRPRRAAVPVRAHPDALQRHPQPVRPVHRGGHPAQREPHRRVAVRARRAGRRRPRRSTPRHHGPAAGGLLPGPGPGAAIRRARTRLPGGDLSPAGDHPGPPGADGRPRHRLLPGPRGRAPGRCPPRSRRVPAQGPAPQRDRPARERLWRSWERWISEIVADLWSVATPRDLLDARAARRRQPAPVLRLPPLGRRPPPDSVRPRPAQLRHGRGALPPPAVGEPARHLEVPVPRRHPAAGTPAEFAALEAGIPAFVGALLTHRSPSLAAARSASVPRPASRAPPVAAAAPSWRSDIGVMARQRPAWSSPSPVRPVPQAASRPETESPSSAPSSEAWALRSTLAATEQSPPSRRVLARAS